MSETLNHNLLFEIDGFPDYYINRQGEMWSDKYKGLRMLKPGLNKASYRHVALLIKGTQSSHRISRMVAKTFIPNPENKEMVDHINRIRTDDRVENLRWVTRKENSRNRSKYSNNTSGLTGVSFRKDRESWRTYWCDNIGKLRSKYFSINKYGKNQAKRLAIEYRLKMEEKFYPTLTKT